GRWVVAPIRRISVWMQERLAIWILILFSIGLVAAGIALAVFMYRRQFGTVMNPEVLDFLQVAANISTGQGMKTLVLRPFALPPDFAAAPVTDLYHPPLPLLVWGFAFAVLGRGSEFFSVCLAGFLIGLTSVLLFHFTSRLLNQLAGLLAVGLLLLSPLTLTMVGNGQPATLAAALFLLWLAVMTRKETWNLRVAVGSGLMLGMVGLSQGLALFAAPVALLSKRWESRRARLWFLVSLLLVLLPYGLRNFRWAGHPFTPWKAYAFLWDTRSFPGDSVYRHSFTSTPSPFRLTFDYASEVARKSLVNFSRMPKAASSWGWLVVLSALLSLLWIRRWKDSPLRFLASIFFVNLVSVLVLLAFTRVMVESTFFLLPLGCLLAAATISELGSIVSTWLQRFQQLSIPQWLRQWALPVILSLGLLYGQGMLALSLVRTLIPQLNPGWQGAQLARLLVPSRETLLASDDPRLIAFHLRRPVVWLPCHRDDWERLSLLKKVTHIWFSPTALMKVGGDGDTALRLSLVVGEPFLGRFHPILVRDARYIRPTPFLMAAPESVNNRLRIHEDKNFAQKSTKELVAIAQKYIQEKKYAEAEKVLLVVLRRQPSAEGFFNLGTVWLMQNRYFEALRAFQAALGESPGFFPAANNLAWTYLQIHEKFNPQGIGYLIQAERWAEYALELCPDIPEIKAHVLDTAAWADFWRGRTTGRRPQVRWRLKRALARLHEAYKILPDNPDINYHLAMVYMELGETQKAQQYLEKTKAK
ncbi:MAG: tetratricopeptide repeat protein, partial [Armatimonadota bacterium]|nr:tetratricopeptide repeat protein [Armatimonadota bacterium]MDW8143641.1 tetratricopeptide repeat protein [Armatimonadota bacterium]